MRSFAASCWASSTTPTTLPREFGAEGNLVVGANIAGFLKVADAMLAQGIASLILQDTQGLRSRSGALFLFIACSGAEAGDLLERGRNSPAGVVKPPSLSF